MNFNFSFNPQDEEYVKNVCIALNDAYVKFKKMFCVDYNGCLNVKVFSTREEYKQWTGYGDRYENWMVGRCNADENEIGILVPAEAGRTEVEMLLVAKHELSHFLMNKCFGKSNSIVLGEGIACYLAGQMPNKKIQNSSIISCKKLEEEKFANLGGYTLAPVYVKHIVDSFGIGCFIELFKSTDYLTNLPDKFEHKAVEKFNEQLSSSI